MSFASLFCGHDSAQLSIERANEEILQELQRIEANGGEVSKDPVNLPENQASSFGGPFRGMFACREQGTLPQMEGPEFFAAAKEHSLKGLLEAHGGIVQVLDVFPESVAERALQTLKTLPKEEWCYSTHTEQSLIAKHRFRTYPGPAVDFVKDPLKALGTGYFPTMNAARYDRGGTISIHNDAASREVFAHDAQPPAYPVGMTVYRKIALIYYLTKDWDEAYGGCLIDNLKGGPRVIVPEFNSLVAFLVPREHQVTAVAAGAPTRYSIFGWFNNGTPYMPGEVPPLGSGNPDLSADSDEETDVGPEDSSDSREVA
mmetsp:Transcript_58821/g.140246  ORF Transcript_58821/g.140246 Transcript_58821/m.140246 type:complete len:315 (-) Transcript_58821:103-1047(-)